MLTVMPCFPYLVKYLALHVAVAASLALLLYKLQRTSPEPLASLMLFTWLKNDANSRKKQMGVCMHDSCNP